MTSARLVVVACLIGLSEAASAQELVPGSYSGSMAYRTMGDMPRTRRVDLVIETLEADRFEGWVFDTLPGCRDGQPVSGRLRGNVLEVRSKLKKVDRMENRCRGIRWELKVKGDALEGTALEETVAGAQLRLSRTR